MSVITSARALTSAKLTRGGCDEGPWDFSGTLGRDVRFPPLWRRLRFLCVALPRRAADGTGKELSRYAQSAAPQGAGESPSGRLP